MNQKKKNQTMILLDFFNRSSILLSSNPTDRFGKIPGSIFAAIVKTVKSKTIEQNPTTGMTTLIFRIKKGAL